ILVAYLLYASVYVPARQASLFRQAVSSKKGERILEASDGFFRPYNFLQPSLRAQLDELLYNNKLFFQPSFRPLIDKALGALEEAAEREQDPRYYVRLVEMHNELAKQDPSLLEKSEAFARKALALSPDRQGLLNHLAFALAGRGKFKEAIETDRRALALDPRVYKSHYQLGLVLLLAGETERAEALKELDLAWEMAKQNHFLTSRESDFRNMLTISKYLEDYRKTVDVLEDMLVCHVNVDRICFPNDKQIHLDLLRFYGILRDDKGLVRTAERMKGKFPELSEDLDVIIDLAKKKNWEILDSF
ncbi:MAG: hypothetical protein HY475_01800, partial [Candidatus Terrybacteria bacterium]|nr:hypothetical protein [Candidatus Terrybacteria bacterium]